MKGIHLIFVVAILCGTSYAAYAQEETSSSASESKQYQDRVRALADDAMKAETAKEQQFIDPLVRQAKEAVAKRNYSDAERLFRRAIATYKDLDLPGELDEVSIPLAEVYERLGKPREAITVYRDLVAYKPHFSSSIASDPTTHMKFVLALARDHQWAEAANVYNKMMDRQARHDDESTGFHRSLMSPEEAARYVDRYMPEPLYSVRFDPDQPNLVDLQAAAHYLLGVKEPHWGGKLGEKEAHLKAAIKFRPQWALAHYTYGELLLTMPQHGAEARQQFALAAKLTDDPEMKKEASKKVSWLAPLDLGKR